MGTLQELDLGPPVAVGGGWKQNSVLQLEGQRWSWRKVQLKIQLKFRVNLSPTGVTLFSVFPLKFTHSRL